jgi:glycosyltransferase involved in cell wall biosynthesis
MKKQKILVIIPCYNEEKHIFKVISSVRKTLGKSVDILVINDASTDHSSQEINRASVDQVIMINRVKYGTVLQTGFKYAKENGYTTVATIDGDDQHDPLYLVSMLQLLKDNDLIIGSRFIEKTEYKMPFLRRLGSMLFSTIVRVLGGKKIYDPTSGYQMFNEKVLSLYCEDDYPIDYPDADVILKLIFKGIHIKEIAVRMRPNLEKSMHSGLSVIYYVFKMFLSILVTVLNYSKLKRR